MSTETTGRLAPGEAPTSTYRLQLGPDLDLRAAGGLVDRLAALGVGAVYLSPILQAAPGSTHGYDTVDHDRVSAELGGRAALDALAERAHAAGLAVVVDVVPNHMSIADAAANRWWWDVLEHGPASRFADHFDITWESQEARQVDTVLLPVLGDHYGRVLEAGDLVLERRGDAFVVRYFDHVFPLAPSSLVRLLGPLVDPVDDETFAFVVDALVRLPDTGQPGGAEHRHRDVAVLRRLLAGCLDDDDLADAVDAEVAAVSADPERLHDILEDQHYRLCHWRRAQHDLDYRRFFDIDTLIGLRIEDPRVFDDTHRLVVELTGASPTVNGAGAGPTVDGLRIDHPDGLSDPVGYFERLAEVTGGVWTVIEKILEPGEVLPQGWPVAGTTGYDFLHVAGGVMRHPDGVAALTDHWRREVDADGWDETVAAAKDEILRSVLAADVGRLAEVGVLLCEHHRRHRDFTRFDVTHAVRALAAAFSVYRTYVGPEPAPATDVDRAVIDRAAEKAASLAPEVDADLFEFFAAVLRGERRGEPYTDEFVERFQQLTGPTMAKSVEDTSFYRHLPVPAANEVGGDPGRPVTTVDEFHAHNRRIQSEWPATMTALTTHDTKRSADVRARLDALTGVPERWLAFLDRWLPWSDDAWTTTPPDRRTSVLTFATLVGAWPIDRDRLAAYLEKATKEAKLRTSWTDADAAFDAGVVAFADAVLAEPDLVVDLVALVGDVLVPGRHRALALQLLQLTSPGVPDCYQGSELWDLSLVDPDNRRPVDHDRRAVLLDGLMAGGGPTMPLAEDDEGVHKLWLTHQALVLRSRRPACFGPADDGRYDPLDVGADGTGLGGVAYTRGGSVAVAVATPGPGSLRLTLPAGEWRDLLTGTVHRGETVVQDLLLAERIDSGDGPR